MASTKVSRKSAKKKYTPSAKQRASDEKLREKLRDFDIKIFDKGLEKAIRSTRNV